MTNRCLPLLVLSLLAACAQEPNLPSDEATAQVADREPDENVEKDPLLSEARVAHVVVPEAFVGEATPQDNIDSPASWIGPDGTLLVAATAKKTGKLVIYDGHSGRQLRSVGAPGAGLGQLDRPNGIAILDGYAWVVERDNHRVQMFRLPDFTPLLTFGADDLTQPYGLWVRPHEDGYEVIVSDNYMSPQDEDVPPPLAELDRRFRRYQVQRAQDDWSATLTGSFGETTPEGAIRIAESLWGDADNDRLLIAEEDVATGTRLREYSLDGRYRGRDIGADLYKAQAEGIALMRCADGSGWWISTDQFKDRSVFHVYDRLTLEHVGAFAGEVTANTDGVWLDERGDARFPQGAFFAIHDDQALAAFDWRDIARALNLPTCER